MVENPHTKDGVPTTLRTVILIRRRSRARFSANFHILEQPPMRAESVLQYMRGILGAFQEDPLVFDPEGRNKDYEVHKDSQTLVDDVKYGSHRLDGVDLQSVVAVEHTIRSTDFGRV